jgi:hypothetical protein
MKRVQVFSVFHARLLQASELVAWGRRLSDDKARKVAEWMSGYTGKFARSIEEFLGEHDASIDLNARLPAPRWAPSTEMFPTPSRVCRAGRRSPRSRW